MTSRLKTIADLPTLDFNSAEHRENPFPILADLAGKWRVARSSRGVEVLDYDLCRQMIVDPKLGTGHPRLMKVLGLPDGPVLRYKQGSISFFNRGEKRRKLRQPLTRLLSPKGSERFRGEIETVVADIISDVPKTTSVDLIRHICDPTPSRVYCQWMGASKNDAAYIARTSHTVQQVHARNPERTAEIVAAFEDFLDYADERIVAARENQNDTLISDLVSACDVGELTEADLRNWVIKLAEANTDNSSHQIASVIIELASRPGVWSLLRSEPELIPVAVGEVMRLHPRSISTSREALEDLEIDGVIVPKDTPVFANIGAAHWDKRYYPDPGTFSLERQGQPAHLNFGGGIFSCIGRHIVTIEIEEVIARLTQDFPDLRIDEAQFDHTPMFTNVSTLRATLRP
ncbi:MAG: cytochrome P450 [Geminicoccaceae bacterium]